ncbi:MAG TPA: glucose-6-phosphate isomerase [Methylomirabilota bacterium]|nr:glucose-6-phosphate isomerase [Methylomirabilota bacterium]
MKSNNAALWERFKKHNTRYDSIGLTLDLSRMKFPDNFFTEMAPKFEVAFREMAELERGAIANPDENRMVGHYWLRSPELAPDPKLREVITETLQMIKNTASVIHSGKVRGEKGQPFKNLLIIGIGGSALGPQFVANALSQPGKDKLKPFFFDNTDPDGMDKVLAQLAGQLDTTLTVVISKSGGTKETRNGMLEAKWAYEAAGLTFAKHAMAVTGAGSQLYNTADKEGWLATFPMWDWVGGRTSETSAVGLLPAALQGFDIDGLLRGAAECDKVTRVTNLSQNPAAQLAAMWHYAGQGRGAKDMVVLPYKDRIELISKYLQQLIMESLGKELDKNGQVVNQGLAVYGNKGSTDQHAYIQQLREGLHNFFVTFIHVRRTRSGSSKEVDPGLTTGDYIHGFYLGTRKALFEKDRESISITIDEVSAFSIGVLIALFERAVGFYATLVNINAYHQPGVEAGKKAADAVLALQSRLVQALGSKPKTVDSLAQDLGSDDPETLYHLCEHLAANPDTKVRREASGYARG